MDKNELFINAKTMELSTPDPLSFCMDGEELLRVTKEGKFLVKVNDEWEETEDEKLIVSIIRNVVIKMNPNMK